LPLDVALSDIRTKGQMNARAGCLRCSVAAAALVMVSTSATAQVYKTVDPSGTTVYTNQPPMGLANAGSHLPELKGRWTVASIAMDGGLLQDPEMTGSSWTFQGSELTIQSGSTAHRFTVKPDVGVQPKAFHVTLIPPRRTGRDG
jgi:hypothetical protein